MFRFLQDRWISSHFMAFISRPPLLGPLVELAGLGATVKDRIGLRMAKSSGSSVLGHDEHDVIALEE